MLKLIKKNQTIVSIGGGLGNQLFQFSAGLFAAGEDQLVLELGLGLPNRDKSMNPEILQYILPKSVTVLERQPKTRFTMRSVNFAMIWGKSARRNPKHPLSILINFASSLVVSIYFKSIRILRAAEGVGYHKTDFNRRYTFLVGYFQTYFWASQEPTYSKLKNLRLKVEDLAIEEYKRLAIDEKPLVVHVRLGDYKSIESFGIPSQKYYDEAISELWHSGDYGKIWIFTNEQDEAAQYLPGWVIENCRWVPEIGGSAAQTLEVMRYGAGYVIANSTYSWWGAFLSYTPNPKVIAPTPWFKGEPSPLDIIHPTWKTVKAWRMLN